MRSSRNIALVCANSVMSLIDWKMRSSRNEFIHIRKVATSLIDWKMRSSRNYNPPAQAFTWEFNRLENAL